MTLDINSIKGMMDTLDPAALLPDINTIVDWVAVICRLAILVGPLVLVGLGLGYLLFAPREANYYFGYRTTFGMGSVSAWRHTQKVAGFLFLGVGAVFTLAMIATASSYSSRDAMDIVWSAVRCLSLQVVVTVVINMTIGSIAAMTFDYKGNKRKKR